MHKLVLLALADRADCDHCCFPSKALLVADTGMDVKTIWQALKELAELGLITDTGRRAGQTKQVTVWRLNGVESRHKDSPDNGTLPKTEGFRFSSESIPKTDRKAFRKRNTESTSESTKNLKPPFPLSRPRFDPLAIVLPDCLSIDQWRRWVEYRRSIKKPITLSTADAQLRQLVDWHRAGHDPNEILATSIRNSWQGIFQPKPGDSHGTHPRQDNSAVARVERAIRDQEARELRERDGPYAGGHVIDVGREDYQHLPHPPTVEADD